MSERLLIQGTTALSRWISAAAIVGAALVYLTVSSYVRGAAAPIAEVRSSPIATATVPPLSQALPIAKFRFGFLEFENDPDTSTEWSLEQCGSAEARSADRNGDLRTASC